MKQDMITTAGVLDTLNTTITNTFTDLDTMTKASFATPVTSTVSADPFQFSQIPSFFDELDPSTLHVNVW